MKLINNTPAGFTLVELVIVLAIAGIFAILAIPAFGTFTSNNRLINTVNGIAGGIYYARSESIVRGENISICAGNNISASPGCSNTNDWSKGYTVFIDVNENGNIDSTDTVLRFQRAYNSNVEISQSSTAKIRYNNEGFLTFGSGDLDFCTDALGRRLSIAANGSVRLPSIQPSCL